MGQMEALGWPCSQNSKNNANSQYFHQGVCSFKIFCLSSPCFDFHVIFSDCPQKVRGAVSSSNFHGGWTRTFAVWIHHDPSPGLSSGGTTARVGGRSLPLQWWSPTSLVTLAETYNPWLRGCPVRMTIFQISNR